MSYGKVGPDYSRRDWARIRAILWWLVYAGVLVAIVLGEFSRG